MIHFGSPAFNNDLVAAFAVILVVVGIVVSVRRRRRLRRARLNLCAKCGYDRMGLAPDALCPECGSARS